SLPTISNSRGCNAPVALMVSCRVPNSTVAKVSVSGLSCTWRGRLNQYAPPTATTPSRIRRRSSFFTMQLAFTGGCLESVRAVTDVLGGSGFEEVLQMYDSVGEALS